MPRTIARLLRSMKPRALRRTAADLSALPNRLRLDIGLPEIDGVDADIARRVHNPNLW